MPWDGFLGPSTAPRRRPRGLDHSVKSKTADITFPTSSRRGGVLLRRGCTTGWCTVRGVTKAGFKGQRLSWLAAGSSLTLPRLCARLL
jgi:hypothetical protein